jgi:hypothetical protein
MKAREKMTTQTDHRPGAAADPDSSRARVAALREGGSEAIVRAARTVAVALAERAEENASWPERRWRQLNQDAAIGSACNALRVEPELGTPVRGGVPATKAVRTTAPPARTRKARGAGWA